MQQLMKRFMASTMKRFLHCWFLFLWFSLSNSADIITINQSFRESDQLISKGKSFAFGFFSPGRSGYRYLGIWFHEVSERSVVWVANRHKPVNGSSAVLFINKYGNLVLHNDPEQQVLLWSTNVSMEDTDTCVQLLDSGNLVLLQGISKRIVWQSFDYPTNTHLQGMRVGMNHKVGLAWDLSSWKTADDPGIGEYSFKLRMKGLPEATIYKGSKPHWRFHLWPSRKNSDVYNSTTVSNQDGIYSLYYINDASLIIRIMVDHLGFFKWLLWHKTDGRWKEFWSTPKYPCDFYAKCGPNGLCTPPGNSDAFECSCLPGYEPKSPGDWYLRDASQGCVRKRLESSSVCRHGEGFMKVKNVKFPDTSKAAWVGTTMNRKECEKECLRNCSCSAYSHLKKDEKVMGCLAWYGELMDTVDHMDGNLDMYVRIDAVELENERKSKSLPGRKERLILGLLSAGVAWLTILVFVCLWFRKRRNKGIKNKDGVFDPISGSIYEKNILASCGLWGKVSPSHITFFDLRSIITATKNFSPENKLGQGGFSTVYRGQLFDKQEVAVKRLSKNFVQSKEEFKNEVMLAAKLQHRNLVKLLGCCIEEEEHILLYEYLPNKSLDLFLFDHKNSSLDWRKRFNIINGVARGILYLHQDSRLSIIHRDLKSSNILLDEEMNPKISDFGIARIFKPDQIEDKTKQAVGTYGYMSPEYAIFGEFSVKSDVFSFGVISLEIITGKKSSGFPQTDTSLSLLGHVWALWKEGRVLEIVDSSLRESCSLNETLRSIQIGLLCVQENIEDRPTMLEVVLMLSTEAALPAPEQPPFVFTSCSNNCTLEVEVGEERLISMNEVTITQ